MTATHLGCHTRGSLDRPGPTFSKGVMSSVSHKLEQMMHKFSPVFSISEALVTMPNGYSIKYSQCSFGNASQSDSLNSLIFINSQTQPFIFTQH